MQMRKIHDSAPVTSGVVKLQQTASVPQGAGSIHCKCWASAPVHTSSSSREESLSPRSPPHNLTGL